MNTPSPRSGGRLCLLFILLGAAAGCSWVKPRPQGPGAEVPPRFRQLYSELDLELAGAEKSARAQKGPLHACPAMAPALFPASSYFGPAEPGTPRWEELMTELDGFQALGAGAVSIMISFPSLTPEVKDPELLLKFYAAMAAEVRARGMKLLVEHFVYPPSAPTKEGRFVAAIKTLPDPAGTFLDLKKKEILLILSRIKPDYLSVITEPETYDRFLGISIPAEDHVRWLNGLIGGLPGAGGKGGTKLGAGAGVWESGLYVPAFAKVTGLDYIDIHFYPLKLGSEELFPKFLDLIARVKAEDPAKELVVSETWLYKHSADEPKGAFSTEAYGRNAYDFWAPLDARFLELMNLAGEKNGISLVAPYFPQFFFAARQFEPAVPQPAWPASMTEEWRSAKDLMSGMAVTPAGKAFKEINRRCKD